MVSAKQVKFASTEPCCDTVWFTPDWARQALGLEENEKGELKIGGKRYKAANNKTNRPIRAADRKRYMAEMLGGNWEFTGESMCFDTKGHVVSGQHRQIAILDAEAELLRDPGAYRGVKLEFPQVVSYGVKPKSADKVDTGVSRNATDVIYRKGIFKDLELRDAKKCSADLAVAQRLVWLRMRGKPVSRGGRQHNQQMLDTLKAHPKLEVAVRFIYELDQPQFGSKTETDEEGNETQVREEIKAAGSISNKISRGYAAALLYLQAACGEDRDLYEERGYGDFCTDADVAGVSSSVNRRKAVLEAFGGRWYGSQDQEFETGGIVVAGGNDWQEACKFWFTVSEPYGQEKGSPVMAWIAYREKMRGDENTNRDEIVGVTIKAWNAEVAGEEVKTPSKLALKKVAGVLEFPVIGGLDIGEVEAVVRPDGGEEEEGDEEAEE